MQVLVTGASGMVGGRVVSRLLDQGHGVVAVSREPAAHDWPVGVETVSWSLGDPPRVDAVIHLAGANIAGRRWTARRKAEILRSRVDGTRALVAWAGRGSVDRPPAWVQASAVGYYGRDPDGPCAESRPPGTDFLADVCARWEAASQGVSARRVVLRFGHVLDPRGGLLERLRPLYKARIAGVLGTGKQRLPWVHHDDLARMLVAAATDASWQGTYNATAPVAPTYREVHQALRRVFGRSVGPPVPTFALRVAVGGIAPFLTGGQDVRPERLAARSFPWRHPDLDEAVDDALR